jgi:hypothetical protein
VNLAEQRRRLDKLALEKRKREEEDKKRLMKVYDFVTPFFVYNLLKHLIIFLSNSPQVSTASKKQSPGGRKSLHKHLSSAQQSQRQQSGPGNQLLSSGRTLPQPRDEDKVRDF